MATIQIRAYFDNRKGESVPQDVKIRAEFATLADADAALALFPKSCRAFTCRGRRADGEKYAIIAMEARLVANGSNGGKNETGIKRYRAFIAKAAKLGFAIAFIADRAVNAYQTAEAFESVIA
jgi:hypothetical protein